MHKPLEIVFNNMGKSEFIEDAVRKHFSYIDKHFKNLTSCYVAVSAPHKSHRKGTGYEVHIRARVPGTEIAVSHNPGDNNTHDDMQVLLRDAFSAFESQLQKLKTKKHHRLRTAAEPPDIEEE